jgi:hypothetical protein
MLSLFSQSLGRAGFGGVHNFVLASAVIAGEVQAGLLDGHSILSIYLLPFPAIAIAIRHTTN